MESDQRPYPRERYGPEPLDRDYGRRDYGRADYARGDFGRREYVPAGYDPRMERRGGMWPRGNAFGLGPRGFRRSDEKLYDDVCIRLTEDPIVDASDVAVEVRSAEVILRGTVDSREAKRRAEDIVEGVPGVADVRNELRIRREGFAGVGRGPERMKATGQRTVAALFDDIAAAQRAVEELRTLEIDRDQISLVTRDTRSMPEAMPGQRQKDVAGPAGTGAVLGGLAGGAFGWLLGIGAITIPGFGPVIAAGAIATAIGGAVAGAAAGGLVGALVSIGIPESEARDYERHIREGAVLVTVSGISDEIANRAKEILGRTGGKDVRAFEGESARGIERTRGNGEPVVARR
jgi:hypothetical protein